MKAETFKKQYEKIPDKYLESFQNKLILMTDLLLDGQRTREIHRVNFNKCEECGYDLFSPSAYQICNGVTYRHPYKGYVHYYNNHKMVLCDKCVDEKNGHPWTERG